MSRSKANKKRAQMLLAGLTKEYKVVRDQRVKGFITKGQFMEVYEMIDMQVKMYKAEYESR